MWHQLWFVVPTLISFDMFVTSITWQHVPGPPAFQCATLKVGCGLGMRLLSYRKQAILYYKQMLNPPAPTVYKHWIELKPFKPVHLLSSMTSMCS